MDLQGNCLEVCRELMKQSNLSHNYCQIDIPLFNCAFRIGTIYRECNENALSNESKQKNKNKFIVKEEKLIKKQCHVPDKPAMFWCQHVQAVNGRRDLELTMLNNGKLTIVVKRVWRMADSWH